MTDFQKRVQEELGFDIHICQANSLSINKSNIFIVRNLNHCDDSNSLLQNFSSFIAINPPIIVNNLAGELRLNSDNRNLFELLKGYKHSI